MFVLLQGEYAFILVGSRILLADLLRLKQYHGSVSLPLRRLPSSTLPVSTPGSCRISLLLSRELISNLHDFPNSVDVVQSEALGVTPTIASYPSCINIAAAGISPFIWTPVVRSRFPSQPSAQQADTTPQANVYGNRPVLMLSTLISIVGGVGSGLVTSFNQLYATRLIQGLGFGASMAVCLLLELGIQSGALLC